MTVVGVSEVGVFVREEFVRVRMAVPDARRHRPGMHVLRCSSCTCQWSWVSGSSV